jgi:hypothetical protein
MRPVVRWLLALGAMRIVSALTMPLTVPRALAALRPPLSLGAALAAAGWLALAIGASLLAGALANRALRRWEVSRGA